MDIDKPNIDHENDLTNLERRLAAWRPAVGVLDRDRMLFNSGRASAQAEGRLWSWRLATGAMFLVSAVLGGFLVRERSQRVAIETALASRSGPSELFSASVLTQLPIDSLGPSTYRVLTARVTSGLLEMSAQTVEIRDERPEPTSPCHSSPLRVRDFQRVFDL